MAEHFIRSEFWDRHNERMRPKGTRAEAAAGLSAVPIPNLPSTLAMREARDAIVAMLGEPGNDRLPDEMLTTMGRLTFYLGWIDRGMTRMRAVNEALAHVAWDFFPMTGAEKREWDRDVKRDFGGDAEEAAKRFGHRHVIPRWDLLTGQGRTMEERESSSRRSRLRAAFAEALGIDSATGAAR